MKNERCRTKDCLLAVASTIVLLHIANDVNAAPDNCDLFVQDNSDASIVLQIHNNLRVKDCSPNGLGQNKSDITISSDQIQSVTTVQLLTYKTRASDGSIDINAAPLTAVCYWGLDGKYHCK